MGSREAGLLSLDRGVRAVPAGWRGVIPLIGPLRMAAGTNPAFTRTSAIQIRRSPAGGVIRCSGLRVPQTLRLVRVSTWSPFLGGAAAPANAGVTRTFPACFQATRCAALPPDAIARRRFSSCVSLRVVGLHARARLLGGVRVGRSSPPLPITVPWLLMQRVYSSGRCDIPPR